MKLRLCCIVIIFSIFLPSISYAATVHGTLTCVGNPQPDYAIVAVLDLEDLSFVASAGVDENGEYTMDVPDSRNMIIICIAGTGERMDGYDLHEYIAESEATFISPGSNIINFTTAPAYELILVGADGEGNLLGEEDYPNLFIADFNDKAHPILRMGADNDENPYPVPVYNIPLDQAYKLHFQMTLPHAGAVMVVADNDGAGYSSHTQGAQIVSINRDVALWAGNRLEKDIAEATVSTARAEDALEFVSDAFEADDFDEAAGLAITASEDLALSHGRDGIEKYRKGDLEVRVVDAQGNPVPNAWVSATQLDRDFKFGFFDVYSDADPSAWRQAHDDGFNFFTAGFYWSSTEPEDDQYDWDLLDNEVGIPKMDEIGFTIKGHPLIWFYELVMPSYTLELTHRELLDEITEHVSAMVGRYDDTIRAWDVINEAHGWGAAGGQTRDQITSITRDAVDLVHSLDSGATTIVNASFDFFGESVSSERFVPDHDPSFAMPTPEYFEDLIDEGVAFDVIGQQMYNGGCVTLFYDLGIYDEPLAVPTYDMAALRDMLGRLSEIGLPIHLTEHSVPSQMAEECVDIGYWRNPWSRTAQADYLDAWYTLVFGTPAVQAVTWWDLTDAQSFIKYGGLIDENGQPKEAYDRLADLMQLWTTDETGVTGEGGISSFRAFGGEYEISAALEEHQARATVHVYEQIGNSVELVLEDYQVPVDDDDTATPDDDDDMETPADSEDETGRAGGCGCIF